MLERVCLSQQRRQQTEQGSLLIHANWCHHSSLTCLGMLLFAQFVNFVSYDGNVSKLSPPYFTLCDLLCSIPSI